MGLTASVGAGFKGAKKIGESLVPSVQAPAVEEAVEMPDPVAQQAARQRSLVEQLSRRGRQSTILSQGSQKLGA